MKWVISWDLRGREIPLLFFVCHLLKPYSLRHRTKADLFLLFSFDRNDNEACDDEDHESDQSVDDADLNFDEVY